MCFHLYNVEQIEKKYGKKFGQSFIINDYKKVIATILVFQTKINSFQQII